MTQQSFFQPRGSSSIYVVAVFLFCHLFYAVFVGMEAIWKVEVEDFPAFIIVDDKGNDFFKEWQVEQSAQYISQSQNHS